MKRYIILTLLVFFLVKANAQGFAETNTTVVEKSAKKVKKPLLLLDGKEITKAQIEKLDPNSIESINVFKDSTATRLYGARGYDGAIIIHTKKKKEKK